jgi:hypothetical protein
MKKLIYLIVLVLILGMVLTGCSLLSNIGQAPATEQSVPNIITKNTQPIEVCLNFSGFSSGNTVEGMNTVYTGLDIYAHLIEIVTNDGPKKAVVIAEGDTDHWAYGSHPTSGSSIRNGCLGNGNGIAIQRNGFPKNDLYNFVFQFSEDILVSSFSLNILDFGDYNTFNATSHSIALVAYNADGDELTRDTLSYDSDSITNPIESIQFGNLQNSGDACRSIGLGGNLPGNYVFNVNYCGINRVVLELGEGPDSYFGIRNICFTPTPKLEVPVDIKPTSCPNPLNTKSNGVTPVAILGTADFDVTQIDPATVTLAGVGPPLRWDWEDVATPFEPYTGNTDCLDCNTVGLDGYLDLTLKFDTQELLDAVRVLNAIGTVESFEVSEEELDALESGESDQVTTTSGESLVDGDCLVIQLEGFLLNCTPIIGEDVVRILKKGNK